ncbi:MAG: hypothetical protein EAZ97_12750 [Bacteroidetes bacterium]|nr:MAG: hypothetical protein EAZ97_12750 [Bacteroidota bacterium]
MINALELSQKLLNLLKQTPEKKRRKLKKELLKMMPSEKSEVILKIGSGTFPKDNERSIGIFMQIPHCKPYEEKISLSMALFTVLSQSTHFYLEFLNKILDSFEKESLSPYGLTFMPATIIYEHVGCIHFSLIGKIAKTKK